MGISCPFRGLIKFLVRELLAISTEIEENTDLKSFQMGFRVCQYTQRGIISTVKETLHVIFQLSFPMAFNYQVKGSLLVSC
jgi:hypothetical protein